MSDFGTFSIRSLECLYVITHWRVVELQSPKCYVYFCIIMHFSYFHLPVEQNSGLETLSYPTTEPPKFFGNSWVLPNVSFAKWPFHFPVVKILEIVPQVLATSCKPVLSYFMFLLVCSYHKKGIFPPTLQLPPCWTKSGNTVGIWIAK